jgi:hypothetical protein
MASSCVGTDLIQQGISEKVPCKYSFVIFPRSCHVEHDYFQPVSVSFAAAFVTGFACTFTDRNTHSKSNSDFSTVAFARSWRLALALSSILPCMIITGGLMAMVITKQTQYATSPFFPV